MSALAKRLPLTVIGGFLGAGKTTLLNRWLREANGQRLAVLVNDFGALNIDAELIAANTGETIALSNGCVCCQIGDDLSGALIRVLESADRFDAVVIEASGVSDPWRIAQLGRGCSDGCGPATIGAGPRVDDRPGGGHEEACSLRVESGA